MLDAETKRRIDNARDILVGKVPDPKTQVEQITFAMIYKFMDDMDQQSVGIGGEPSFFTNGYEQYAWSKLMDKRLGGEARLDLYVRALDQMSQNPHIPQLFRDIFKGAFLPYRDSETLNLFLKEMQGFTYEHSEDLGDAYEYLLSIFASQGKAGQFRTPRHIIDFIVDCVNPTKDDTMLDPACGTAGFLISAYKHILEAHAQNPLSPDEKQRLTENFVGYDISPDMVRLSRVNMYLHQFPNPTIHEYDTLTTEDRWDENYDVILANPPFMTPKGGIRPHNRFAVRANRSEVLFVDYIAEHLNPGGRAGVVVPEGIIFQSGNAYKALRRMLVEEGYLYGVVSLPAGVFNPYSGVKTSILLLDKTLARRSDSILFVKISADGFDLGAQRREIERDDVPEALRLVKAFQEDPSQPLPGNDLAQIVLKSRLAENGVYNLTASRYFENDQRDHKFTFIQLSQLEIEGKLKFLRGQGVSKKDIVENGRNKCIHYGEIYTLYDPIIDNVISATNKGGKVLSVSGDVLVPSTTTADAMGIAVARALNIENVIVGGDINIIRTKNEFVDSKYLSYLINNPPLKNSLATFAKGANILHLSNSDLRQLIIPFPPLEVQHEIVEEIEGYQKVIDGARQVVENYKPTIPIDPSWPKIKLGDNRFFLIESGGTPRTENPDYWDGDIPWVTLIDLPQANFITYITETKRKISEAGLIHSSAKLLPKNTVLVSSRATIGRIALTKIELATNQGFKNIIVQDISRVFEEYLACILTTLVDRMIALGSGGTYKEVSKTTMCSLEIPLPPLEVQKNIVKEIEDTQKLVDANQQLIQRMEQKIKDRIQRVWSHN